MMRRGSSTPNKTTEKRVHFSPFDASYGFPHEAFDPSLLPDIDVDFLNPQHMQAFERALQAPDPLHSPTPTDEHGTFNFKSPSLRSGSITLSPWITKRNSETFSTINAGEERDSNGHCVDSVFVAAAAAAAAGELRTPTFITAHNDWAPLNTSTSTSTGASTYRNKRVSKKRYKEGKSSLEALLGTRSKDETRDGFFYQVFKWPLLLLVMAWLVGLGLLYLSTRWYIWMYEHFFTWRGKRQTLRGNMRKTANYKDWVRAARGLDAHLGRHAWKEENDFAYYDSRTVKRVWEQMRKTRTKAEELEGTKGDGGKTVDELGSLTEACVKNNFVGIENPKLYSQTYYGTKNLVQNFVDEVEKSLSFLLKTKQMEQDEKRILFKHINANFGRTALCLSGGGSFAYYHVGVIRALLDADLLPDVITGTSGGALIATLVATRTNDELKQLLVPALAAKMNIAADPWTMWLPRWWKTGARFDAVAWAGICSWWSRGSMTFREAYERTGRILNVSCIPADPHSPTILCNYLTSPDCVIWSAVLASAAVPGLLNPVVLMMKMRDGTLAPYSFGHKWKDGSLRTDIPIKALNTHFNVNFTIVSQVNPHINLFFFSSRGSVGHPVTHRNGRGWRGGYLMSAFEHYLKLDMNKWLKFVRHAELLPRPLGQDWSQLFLQQFSGTVTIWPKSIPSDFVRIISDPNATQLARIIHEGQQSTFPKLKFIANRLKQERLVDQGRRQTRPWVRMGSLQMIASEDDLRSILIEEMGAEIDSPEELRSILIEEMGTDVGSTEELRSMLAEQMDAVASTEEDTDGGEVDSHEEQGKGEGLGITMLEDDEAIAMKID